MPDIPKGKRRIPLAERKQFIRREEKADLTDAAITQEIGKGFVAAGDIAERFKADKLTTQAGQVYAGVQDELTRFVADGMTKTGNDAIGSDEYNEFFNKTLSAYLKQEKLEGSKVGDVVRMKFESLNNRFKEKLIFHQEKEQVNASLNNIDRNTETAITQAALFPDMIDEIVSGMNANIEADREIIGDETTEERKRQMEIQVKERGIMEVALTDMEQAEELLSTHRATLPKESVKTIEQEMKRIRNQTEENIKKAEALAQEEWLNDFNKRMGTDDPMTIFEIDNAPISEPLRRSLKKEAINAPGNFEKTDQVVYASFSSAIDLNPDSLTSEDIWLKAGKGLATTDAEKLVKRLEVSQGKGSKQAPNRPGVKEAKAILSFARKDGKFHDDPQQNDIEWALQDNSVDTYVENNPDATPEEIIAFVQKNLIPAQKGFIKSVFDSFKSEPKGEELPRVVDLTERGQAIRALIEEDIPITEGHISEAHRQLTTIEKKNTRSTDKQQMQAGMQGL